MLYEKFTEFVEYVVKNVADFLPSDCIGAEISTQEVQKHGNVLTALTIRKQGSNVAPAIYLDPYYVKYCTSEVDVLDLLKGIAKCYEENNNDEGHWCQTRCEYSHDFQSPERQGRRQ